MNKSNDVRKAQNEQAVKGIRQATAQYVAQLRGEGMSNEAIEQTVSEAQLEVLRGIGMLEPGEEVPAELYQAVIQLTRSMMERGV